MKCLLLLVSVSCAFGSRSTTVQSQLEARATHQRVNRRKHTPLPAPGVGFQPPKFDDLAVFDNHDNDDPVVVSGDTVTAAFGPTLSFKEVIEDSFEKIDGEIDGWFEDAAQCITHPLWCLEEHLMPQEFKEKKETIDVHKVDKKVWGKLYSHSHAILKKHQDKIKPDNCVPQHDARTLDTKKNDQTGMHEFGHRKIEDPNDVCVPEAVDISDKETKGNVSEIHNALLHSGAHAAVWGEDHPMTALLELHKEARMRSNWTDDPMVDPIYCDPSHGSFVFSIAGGGSAFALVGLSLGVGLEFVVGCRPIDGLDAEGSQDTPIAPGDWSNKGVIHSTWGLFFSGNIGLGLGIGANLQLGLGWRLPFPTESTGYALSMKGTLTIPTDGILGTGLGAAWSFALPGGRLKVISIKILLLGAAVVSGSTEIFVPAAAAALVEQEEAIRKKSEEESVAVRGRSEVGMPGLSFTIGVNVFYRQPVAFDEWTFVDDGFFEKKHWEAKYTKTGVPTQGSTLSPSTLDEYIEKMAGDTGGGDAVIVNEHN